MINATRFHRQSFSFAGKLSVNFCVSIHRNCCAVALGTASSDATTDFALKTKMDHNREESDKFEEKNESQKPGIGEGVDGSAESAERFCEIPAGRVLLDFSEGRSVVDDRLCPKSYFTVSQKERLLLIYGEFFRRKYLEVKPRRNPLILAVRNECEVEKFVSTTIRPTVFLFPELIDCWKGPADFVADFIAYEPLEDQLKPVSS